MKENIFKDAKFGDKFVLRNNDNNKEFIGIVRSVRPDCNFVSIVTQPKDGCIGVYFDYSNYKLIDDRKSSRRKERIYRNIEVISRYQESIDEKKLDELAEETMDKLLRCVILIMKEIGAIVQYLKVDLKQVIVKQWRNKI